MCASARVSCYRREAASALIDGISDGVTDGDGDGDVLTEALREVDGPGMSSLHIRTSKRLEQQPRLQVDETAVAQAQWRRGLIPYWHVRA